MTKMFEVHELKIFERNSNGLLGFPKYVIFLNELVYETNNFMGMPSIFHERNLDKYFYNAYTKIAEFNVSYDNLQENFEDLIKLIKNKFPEIFV